MIFKILLAVALCGQYASAKNMITDYNGDYNSYSSELKRQRTSYPRTDASCEDTPDWEDQFGDGCDWYEVNDVAANCPEYGSDNDGGRGVAIHNCCHCYGAGAGSLSPSPATSFFPTKMAHNMYLPVQDKESYSPTYLPSATPTDLPSAIVENTPPPFHPVQGNNDYNDVRRPQPVRALPRVPNPIMDIVNLTLEWARLSERGPTISGHFLVMVNIALFEAWAAFEQGTTGIISDLEPIRSNSVKQAQVYAMTDASYEVLMNMGSVITDQAGENAEEILDGLMDEALSLRDRVLNSLSLSIGQMVIAKRVSTAVSSAILNHIEEDGSNFVNQYSDTSGYKCTNWCSPEPSIDDGITDYDFLDGTYKFNTFDAVAAKKFYGDSTPSQAIHPSVVDGTIQLTETWQSLSQIGFFPGGGQYPLTPHWGNVASISMESGDAFRSEYIGPYDSKSRNLRQEWIEETAELVDLGEQQQPGNCPRCRAESEYWELGDTFVYPPGWWISRANDFASSLDLDIKTTLQLSLGTSIAVFDAGIAAWDMKYAFDSVRPFTAVNELFFGTMVSDWTGDSPGNKLANIDEENFWRPYQRKRNASPPFPDVPSGHSVFSTSASVVLRNLLRTNVFDFTTEPFVSRFDTKGGFDGDESNDNEEATLDFKTISQAADAAGYSRLLGGIHMMQGNVIGLEMGAKVGHSTLRFLRYAFGEDDLGLDPVEDVNTDIVFGTGKNDELLVAPCGVGPVEVYGLYGDDVLESAVGEECGVVSLFGGFGTDTFRIGGDDVKIQDYDSGELILLLREEGAVSYPVLDNGFHSVTMVYVDNVLVLELQGIWTESEINVRFESPGVRNSPRASNPIPYFVDLSLEWARLSERGPTISGHFMVMMNIAMFDAWAAFEQGTEGIFMDFGGLKTMAEKHVQVYAMTDAAYEVMTFMGNSICDQDFLEDVNGEFAVEILADLNGQALALKNDVMDDLGLSPEEIVAAKRVSTAVRDAILEHILVDGSNFQNKYSDTTGFTVTPWCTPEPTVDDGISDYDFLDGSYTFNTFDPVVAKDYYAGTTPAMAVHPLVLDGTLTLTETWQSLCQIGFFPGEKDGGAQVPLTPHWGGVMPISMPAGDSFRSVYIGPYDEYGNIRQEWIDETTELVDLGKRQQAGNNARSRAESEYWELGDSFVYPPGWWMSRANDFARSRDMDLKATLQLIVGTSVTVFDAGIAAWDMKYAFDSVRPFTAVNELFFGTMVSDWTGDSPGNKLANIDERNFWRPYQLRRNSSPPFPDVPSGHSVFSTSASVVLRNLLRTNVFDFVSEPFICRFDTDGGFDGDESNGNEEATLDFKTISQAADAAGYSRLLGGIHMMQGNVVGLEMGAKVGHSSLQFLRRIFGEDDLGLDPVEDVNTDIVFGTGKNDHLSAPCGVGPVEVYGLYGDDVLVSDVEEECGVVSLFGGFGMDEFHIGGVEKMTTIQDYESGELILLLQGEGAITYRLEIGLSPATTVYVDNVFVVDLQGIWTASELNVRFGGDDDGGDDDDFRDDDGFFSHSTSATTTVAAID